jgi:hypothetical protein
MPDLCDDLLAELQALGCYGFLFSSISTLRGGIGSAASSSSASVRSGGNVALSYQRRCPRSAVAFDLARVVIGTSRYEVLEAALDYEWSPEANDDGDRAEATKP